MGDIGTPSCEPEPSTLLDSPQTPTSTKSAKFSVSPKLGLRPVYLLGRRSWYNLRCKFKQEESARGFELISSSAQYANPSANWLPLPVNNSHASGTNAGKLGESPKGLGEPFGGADAYYSVFTPDDSDRESAFSYDGPFRQLSMHFYKRQSPSYDYDSEYEGDDDYIPSDDDYEEDLSHLEDPRNGFYQHRNVNTTKFDDRESYDDLIDEVSQLTTEEDQDDFAPALSRSRSEIYQRHQDPTIHRRYSMVIRGSDRVVTLFSPLHSPARDQSVRSNRTVLTPITETPPPPFAV